MLGTPCAKDQHREQASVPLEVTSQQDWKAGEQGGVRVILGGPLEVPVKALEFPWSRVDGNLERVKQEADTV